MSATLSPVVRESLLDGVVYLFRPLDGDRAAVGRPHVVFAGNVGADDTLTEVVTRLRGARWAATREVALTMMIPVARDEFATMRRSP